jgi:hypothetical protein
MASRFNSVMAQYAPPVPTWTHQSFRSFSLFWAVATSLIGKGGSKRRNRKTITKLGQGNHIVSKPIEQVSQTLEVGHCETLKNYLVAVGRFHRYSLRSVLPIAIPETNSYARRWHSYLAHTRTFREDRRESDFDFCSGWLGGEMSLP